MGSFELDEKKETCTKKTGFDPTMTGRALRKNCFLKNRKIKPSFKNVDVEWMSIVLREI